MAKEIEEYFVKRLQSYLLEYLQDFSQNNMAKFSLGISTNIVLKNLQIKKQALLNFSFPMYIIDGKIDSITINMPLNYKTQQPEMIIEGVDLQVCTIQEANLFVSNKDQQQQQGVENLKKHKLKIWEEQMAKYFEQLSPPNWIQKIVDGIYNNMSVQIKSFNLRFFNYSIFGSETQLRIKTDIYIKATDSKFQQKFNSDLNSIFKQIEIKNLGITFGKITMKKKDEQSILNQIDILARLTINKNQDQLDKPLQSLTIIIDNPIVFQLNKEQKNYLVKLNEVLQNLEIVQDNFHFRPKSEVKNNYGEWWKYLINAVMQNQKNHKLDLGYSSRRLVLMKRYIELYKRKQTIILVPWLTSWTIQDETKFKKCEEQLSLKDLLKYREWAFYEIRMEAKRYYHSSKDGQNQQSVKPILEIWTNTINNQNSFKDHKRRDDDIPIELEDDEKINLYEILERDKTQVLSSYLKGQNNDPNQIKTQILVTIHSIFLIILETRFQNLVNYSPKNTKIFSFCQCKKCISLIKKPQLDKKKNSSLSQSNSISEVVKQTQKQNEDGSFHTAKEIDSFYEDIDDLNKDESQFSMESSQDMKNNNSQSKNNPDYQKTYNKLVLVFSMIGIRIPIQIFQNGRIRTNQKEDQIYIGEIKFLSPGMIPKIMEERVEDDDYKQSPLITKNKSFKSEVHSSQHREQFSDSFQTRNRLAEFVNEIFEISVSRESQQYFSNSEKCFTNLCEFLTKNEMTNIKSFLEDYESNKHAFQDFSNEQFKIYDKYFQEVEKEEKDGNEESMLLHVIRYPKVDKKWNLLKNAALAHQDKQGQSTNEYTWQGCSNKHRFLQEVHNKLIDIIRRSLFAPFLEDYGDQIIPLCIKNLKEKITFPQDSKCFNLTIQLYLEGVKSKYQIQPNSDKKKKISSQSPLEDQSNAHIAIECQNVILFLSTRSLNSLLDFAQSYERSSLDQGSLYVTQDHKLLECILKSKPLSQEQKKPSRIKFDVKVINKLKFRIVSDQISNVIKTELKFQIKNLNFSTARFDDLFQGIPEYKDTTLYKQHHKFFSANKLIVEQFKIAHKYFSPDYNYRLDELRNNEKDLSDGKQQQSNHKTLSKQHTNQGQSETLFKKQSQTIDPRQALKSQQNSQQQQQQQQQKKKNQKYHIKGIKQTILKTQIVLLKLNATVDNHALLTDQKLYIQIPYLNLKINDSFICFIELILIMQKNIQSENSPQYKHKISQDSLLKAELDTLLNDHKKQQSDCKHCILKYRKTIQLTNILFGVIKDLPKESQRLPGWFNILHRECLQIIQQQKGSQDKSQVNKSDFAIKPKQSGIKITFQSTKKASNHGEYKSKMIFPIFVITRDVGYFKDNIMIHCSASRIKNEGIVIKSIQKLDQESDIGSLHQLEKNDKNSNRDLSFQKSQPSSKRESNQMNQNQLPEKLNKETNYIMVQPAYQVKESQLFWQKLDDKFIFYCRSKEKEMFKSEANLKDFNEKQLEEDQLETENPIYLLLYYNRPLRVGLFANKDNDQSNEKSSKQKIFFSLQKIEAVFQNQYAACNILTTLKNINKIKSILETVHNLVNYDLLKEEIQQRNKLIDSPIKYLDELIIFAYIANIYLKSNESYFKLQALKVMLNVELMNQQQQNVKSSIHNRTSQSLGNHEHYKQKLIQDPNNLLSEEDFSIMRVQSIQFSFNQVSMVDVKYISVRKIIDMLQFQIEDIQISIINNSSRVRENLLTMPWRERTLSQFSNLKKIDKPVAISIRLEFQNMNPKILLSIQQGKIQLSQQRVQDLLIAMNSFYLINIEESVSLRQHLLKYIFLQELDLAFGPEQTVNLFIKNKIQQYKELYFILELEIQELLVVLQEKEQIFFLFQFHQIMMKKKLNQELELGITRIELKPQKISEEKITYPNLIEQNGTQEMVFKLENKVIHIENFKFYIISRYLNELEAFKLKIEQILQKNREELAERYQSDFDLQLQIKLQESFEQNMDSFNYTIQVKNSQLIIPESSYDINQIQIKFDQANLNLTKSKVSQKIPDIQESKTEIISDKKLLIDYEDRYQKTWDNKLELQDIYVTLFDAALKTVEVDYEIHCDFSSDKPITGSLLFAETVNVKLDVPSFEQFLGTSGWKYKDRCRIQPQNLQMKLDLGKLIKVQGFLSSNFAEKSPLFEFSSSRLQKINFDLQLKDTSTQLTRFDQVGQDKLEKIKNAKLFESYKQQRQSKQYSTQQKLTKKQSDSQQ